MKEDSSPVAGEPAPSPSIERHELRKRIASVASRRFGVISVHQLRSLGAGRSAINHLIETGRIFRIHHGVYLVGHEAIPAHAVEYAATLAAGREAFVSHYSAARLWGMLSPYNSPVTNVTTVGRRIGRHAGLKTFYSVRLDETDRHRFKGVIPLTSPARTVLDLAGVASKRTFEAALAEAMIRDLCDEEELFEVVDRYPFRPGARRLRRYLILGLAKPTRSHLERKFLRLARRANVPEPLVNTRVAGYEVDCYWPAIGLVVELDGRKFHDQPIKADRDLVRDSDLATAKLRVLRVSWKQVTEDELQTANRLRRLFGMDPLQSLGNARHKSGV